MLRIKAFGRLALSYEGGALPLPATLKSCSLLLYLLVNKETLHSRDLLAEMFWGNRPQQKARRSLTTALWHIRRSLPEKELIWSDNRSVRFMPDRPIFLDSQHFRDLASAPNLEDRQAAVDLYRGEFLNGFYDDWVISERYRLEAILIDTQIKLMRDYESDGKWQLALDTALSLIGRDPLREEAHRVAMRVYGRLGQRNQAIAQYRFCRETVLEELRMPPMEETTAIYTAIASGEFSSGLGQPRKAIKRARLFRQGHGPFDASAQVNLVGREREQQLLNRAWSNANAGQGGMILIGGEAGVGKTQLLQSFSDSIRRLGVLASIGRCFQFEQTLPYQPVTEALRGLVAEIPPARWADLPDWIIEEVSRLVPELVESRPNLKRLPASVDDDRSYLFTATSQFLSQLTTLRSLILIFEDLHWASESTLAFIHFLHRYLSGEKILLIGSYRPEALDNEHILVPLINKLKKGQNRSLLLSPLSAAETTLMLSNMAGNITGIKPLARRLHLETEGNPFFIMEFIKALFERGLISIQVDRWQGDLENIKGKAMPLPATVNAVIQERLAGLDDNSRDALNRAAVLGWEFDFDSLQEMWGQGIEETLVVVDDCLRRRLISEQTGALGRDYAFTHHKIQEVIYDQMLQRRRELLHRRAGEVLEKQRLDRIGIGAAELAFHYRQGNCPKRAMLWYTLAGDQAKGHYALEEAQDYYTQALLLADQFQLEPDQRSVLLGSRALVFLHLGIYEQARTDLETAMAIHEAGGEREQLVELQLTLAECLIRQGNYGEAASIAEEAYSLAIKVGSTRLTGMSRRWQGEVQRWLGLGREAQLLLGESCELLEQSDDPEALAWARLAFVCDTLCLLREAEPAVTYLKRADEYFTKSANRLGAVQTAHHWGRLKFIQGDLPGAIIEFHRALSITRKFGLHVQECIILGELLVSHVFIGDLDLAENWAETCLKSSHQRGEKHWHGHALFWSGVIAYERGDLSKAEQLLSQSLALGHEVDHQPALWLASHQLSLIHRQLGGPDNLVQALVFAQTAHSAACKIGNNKEEFHARSSLAMIHLEMGELELAFELAIQAIGADGAIDGVFFQEEYLLNLFQVYQANGRLLEAAKFLNSAYQVILIKADKIHDTQQRAAFLENLTVNRAILAAAANLQPS